MRQAGVWLRTVHRALRGANRPKDGAIVLMYHRIARVDADPWGLCVVPENFDAHLQILKRVASPAPLSSLVTARYPPSPSARTVVVTLDDGYADALRVAKPLLEAHGVPATLFVTTGYVGLDREFWWDELERLLLHPGRLPPLLELRVKDRLHRWELGPAAEYGHHEFYRNRRLQSIAAPPQSRHALYHAIWSLLYPLPHTERIEALDALALWAGSRGEREDYLALDPNELAMIADGRLLEIGAHTVTHAPLPAQPAASQCEEIMGSKRTLEEITGRRVTSFSYPHGEHSPQTAAMVRDAGFDRACTTSPGRMGPGDNPLLIPRMNVLDWTADEFERKLSDWFRGA